MCNKVPILCFTYAIMLRLLFCSCSLYIMLEYIFSKVPYFMNFIKQNGFPIVNTHLLVLLIVHSCSILCYIVYIFMYGYYLYLYPHF